ncbi:hypothetical protein ACWGIU_18440 [Streptomyces sp. NPDC054840]
MPFAEGQSVIGIDHSLIDIHCANPAFRRTVTHAGKGVDAGQPDGHLDRAVERRRSDAARTGAVRINPEHVLEIDAFAV